MNDKKNIWDDDEWNEEGAKTPESSFDEVEDVNDSDWEASDVSSKDSGFDSDDSDGDYEDEYEYEYDSSNGVDFDSFIPWVEKSWHTTSPKKFLLNSLVVGLSSSLFFGFVFLLVASMTQAGNGMTGVFGKSYPHMVPFFQFLDSGLGGISNGFLGAFLFLVSATLGVTWLFIVESALDDIWGFVKKQDFSQKFSSYWIVLSVVPVPFMTALSLGYIYDVVGIKSKLVFMVFQLAQVLVAYFSFSLMFKILSKGVLTWKSSMLSSVVATLGFVACKIVFSIGSTLFFKTPIVTAVFFSSLLFAGVAVASAFAFLFAAHSGHVLENEELYDDEDFDSFESHYRPTREIALICLIELTKRFYDGNGEDKSKGVIGLAANELAFFSKSTPIRAKQVLTHLNEVGLVEIFNDGSSDIAILRYSPDKLSLEEFLARVEERLGEVKLPPVNYTSNEVFWSEYQKILNEKFGNYSFKDLFEKHFDKPSKSKAA